MMGNILGQFDGVAVSRHKVRAGYMDIKQSGRKKVVRKPLPQIVSSYCRDGKHYMHCLSLNCICACHNKEKKLCST